MKKKKKWIWIGCGVVLTAIISLLVFNIIANKQPNVEEFNPERGTLTQQEAETLAQRAKSALGNTDYYSGCYLEDGNLIILLKKGYEEKEPEVREIMDQEESVHIIYAKYSLAELQETREKISAKWEKIEGIVSLGTHEDENVVHVGIKNLTPLKELMLRIYLGTDGSVEFANSSGGIDE